MEIIFGMETKRRLDALDLQNFIVLRWSSFRDMVVPECLETFFFVICGRVDESVLSERNVDRCIKFIGFQSSQRIMPPVHECRPSRVFVGGDIVANHSAFQIDFSILD